MLYLIAAIELHGVFYMMSAALLHLVIAPHFINKPVQLNILFTCILSTFILLYWNFSDIEPLIYSLQLAPVCLIFVTLCVGMIPSILTWVMFNLGCMFVLNYYWEPALLSSTFTLIISLLFRNHIATASLKIKLAYATGILIMYELLYAPLTPYFRSSFSFYTGYVVLFAFISLWVMMGLLYFINNYEIQKKKIAQLEKNRMLAELSATISHEIRNPLTSTRGFLQLLKQSNLTDADRKRYLDMALSGVDQSTTILTDFLNYAKPSKNLLEQLNIQQELDHTIRFITPYAADSLVSIDVSHESDTPLFILGESQKLRQCFLNIIKNAIESMPNGGKLSLRTWKHPNAVQISITDTGVGMTPSQLNAIGKPFFTTKEHGTGLGLVVVMNMIQKMNGKISFSSSLNCGTRCSISFQLK
ncbi:HAMP domain-containing sensor histidine kinase [Paenibacillus roseipurpureus]|uniref:histidine kinase n=1 Tax=Paenibacillus roseopurpureus TaxID=2918901 RepID=A0AA96RMR1_9BACL|nr:HAMP domain-containing sensor histidine kinase [Paenibacillus sp. MBLB1832]WNR46731.1 HAMP domain-containing sensor histidine kinase [Paenibacillus sp. MBLB1832]